MTVSNLTIDDAGFQTADALLQTANPGKTLVHVLMLCHAFQSSLTTPRCQPTPQNKKTAKPKLKRRSKIH